MSVLQTVDVDHALNPAVIWKVDTNAGAREDTDSMPMDIHAHVSYFFINFVILVYWEWGWRV